MSNETPEIPPLRLTSISDVGDHRSDSVPVPLPNEVPPPPDLSMLPREILFSSTVETLISQNEDLMARLKVSLRRNSMLERNLITVQNELDTLNKERSQMDVRLDILSEKENSFLDQLRKSEREKHEAQNSLSTLEADFARVNRQLAHEEETTRRLQEELEAERTRRRRYQSRISRYVRPFVDELKKECQKWTVEAENLQRHLAIKENKIESLQSNIEGMIQQIRSSDDDKRRALSTLIQEQEEQVAKYLKQIEELKTEGRVLQEKVTSLEAACLNSAELQNRLILAERRNEKLNSEIEEERLRLQTELTDYRNEAKSLALEKADLEAQLAQREKELKRAELANARFQDQIESLQMLWEARMKKIETHPIPQTFVEEKPTKTEESASSPTNPEPTNKSPRNVERMEQLLSELEVAFFTNKDLRPREPNSPQEP